MKIPDFLKSYSKQTKELLKFNDEKKAMSLAVGGDFEAVGLLEYYLLIQQGLKPVDTVVDVGCGSGRLASQLRSYLSGLYVGIDVVPELFQYAESICSRPDWKFYAAPGLKIPEPDNSADFICFFSVFTHLLHEETFQYLEDARRVIKPNGKIIFSYLEFAIPSHWFIFKNSLIDQRPDKVLNQFVSRDAIQAWTEHLNLSVMEINDGDKPHINLSGQVVRWDDGREMRGKGNLGQSVCVLMKR
ncbi:class I SAM-dependent methyltransferase [Candidatus Contendibacter odensensis]|uniref:Methyltransferase type 11 n=1 Tax=Candidatus Contendobacter odensis Run_B_J11 TaxID=1400861 RepID=A0A7U7J2G9_9GAMM|nr:class I SAM-dependent methyltransferase [Candidatus Contendobacter odensis]CDH44127.1 Methyltransferase type 11 [Candidatus Contendobacter odensis Run_B_J11]